MQRGAVYGCKELQLCFTALLAVMQGPIKGVGENSEEFKKEVKRMMVNMVEVRHSIKLHLV